MEENLIRLLYLSEATEPVTPDTVTPILMTSREKNGQAGICGLLCYSSRYFLQFLEGDEKAVMSLYLKIAKDKRHKNCRVIYVTTANGRIFKDWSMGALGDEHCHPINFGDISKIKDSFAPEKNPAELIANLVSILRSRGSN